MSENQSNEDSRPSEGAPHQADKTKIDAYLQLMQISNELMIHRRQMQWKINFGLWAGLGLAVYFLLAKDVQVTVYVYCLFLLAIVLIGAVYVVWFPSWQVSDIKDMGLIRYYRRQIELEFDEAFEDEPYPVLMAGKELLKEDEHRVRRMTYRGPALFTIALCLLSLALITAKACSNSAQTTSHPPAQETPAEGTPAGP